MSEQYWVSKLDMTLSGRQVSKGQLVQPAGAVNDHRIFGDNNRYTSRYDGKDPILCETDGCGALFADLGTLARHRGIVHAPERNRAALDRAEARKRAEESGETFAGMPVVDEKAGPRGKVPYVKHPAAA